MAWTIRNYNAFIGAAQKEYGLSRSQAGQMYRNMSGRLGRPLYGKDISAHPRISKQEAIRAPRSAAAHKAAITRARTRQERARAPKPMEPTRAPARAPERAPALAVDIWPALEPAPRSVTVHDADEWLDFYDEEYEGEWEDWEGTPEYEEEG